ncbi:MAG: substrate-binding domain-containing protein [Eubacterium sp.]|nr:substrate-binding domain-containing protein [Eubacterium sp.]
MKKKIIATLLAVSMTGTLFAGCGGTSSSGSTSGASSAAAAASSSKSETVADGSDSAAADSASAAADTTDNKDKKIAIIDQEHHEQCLLQIQGFMDYVTEQGYTAVDKTIAGGESDSTVQIQAIDEAITEGVDAIVVNCLSETGLDEVVSKGVDQGIVFDSFDSAIPPTNRLVNVNQCAPETVGAFYVRMGVLAALRVEYPGDDMLSAVEEALADYDGPEIVLGCMSHLADAPVQNAWIDAMYAELENPIYDGKVSKELDINYGSGSLQVITERAQAFIAEDKVDVIISLVGNGIPPILNAFEGVDSDIMVCGCGRFSEQSSYIAKQGEDYFSSRVPYIMYWDITYYAAIAGAALIQNLEGNFNGEVGEVLHVEATGTHPATDFTVREAADGGTEVIMGDPIIMDQNNVAEYGDKF